MFADLPQEGIGIGANENTGSFGGNEHFPGLDN